VVEVGVNVVEVELELRNDLDHVQYGPVWTEDE
jgi:hypothetical protein